MKDLKPRKSVRYTANAIITLIIIALVGLSLELFFRTKPKYGRAGFIYDSNLIFRLTPNFVGMKSHAWGKTGEPRFKLRFNNKGFRGPDFTRNKNKDTKRILVIGDSYTAGLDYPDDLIFTSQWQNMLNKSRPLSYEILNASCPAWGTDQQYLYWKLEGMDLKPDIVVIMFSPNDIREMWNHKLIRVDENAGDLLIKKPTLSFKERTGWKLSTKSSLFNYFQKQLFRTDYGNYVRIFKYFPVNYGVMDSADWDLPLFLESPLPQVDKSYELFEKLLVDIKSDCDQINAEFHLVKLPIRREIDSTYQNSIFSKTIIEYRIEEIARRNDFCFHNFNALLRQHKNPEDIFMDWEYHYDQDGHDWIAKALYEQVKF